ncbi:hypothetical protein [Acaryochloris sp. IP29b_bin.137]|uniref:hypothetical protein n=1 Tax=Acaryochloris sp. IP29b_bin.137 TaxID=2969217 RepID=UPI002603E96F|nr:hypothetical protein [Acaryochloris sp. IP29b_bin.137]
MVLRSGRKQYSHTLYDHYIASGEQAFKFAPDQGPEFFRTWGWQIVHQYDVLEKLSQLKRTTPLLSFRAAIQRGLEKLHIKSAIPNQVVLLAHPQGLRAEK